MPKLILVRGLPGSGKSTYVHNARLGRYAQYFHYEADQFFEHVEHGYLFDASLIKTAHEWCHSNTLKALRDGFNAVVSNTFVSLWEMQKYINLRDHVHNLEIMIVEMKTQYGTVHGVPEPTVAAMKKRWEEVPAEWKEAGIKFIRVE